MLAYVSLVLAVAAAAVNLGWVELSTGHWPGISLGLLAVGAGVLELRAEAQGDAPARRGPRRTLAWIGAGLGLGAALVGVAVYLGWGIAAGRVG